MLCSSRSEPLIRRALKAALNSATPNSLPELARQVGYRRIFHLRRRFPDLCDAIIRRHRERDAGPSRRDELYARSIHRVARRALERAVHGPSPQPITVLSKEIGYRNTSSLYQRFPDLCRKLVVKNRECRKREEQKIRNALAKALQEEPVPSLKQMAARLGHCSQFLRRRFGDLCAAFVSRALERQHFDRERIRKLVENALTQEPPLPWRAVARSVGRSPAHLRLVLPDLCKKVRQRYTEYQKRIGERKRVELLGQVRRAVRDLCESGINPSRKHVARAIDAPAMNWSQVLYKFITQALKEMEAEARAGLAGPTNTN